MNSQLPAMDLSATTDVTAVARAILRSQRAVLPMCCSDFALPSPLAFSMALLSTPHTSKMPIMGTPTASSYSSKNMGGKAVKPATDEDGKYFYKFAEAILQWRPSCLWIHDAL